jgi:hypothetical protein
MASSSRLKVDTSAWWQTTSLRRRFRAATSLFSAYLRRGFKISQELQTISGPKGNADLVDYALKCNSISSETAPLNSTIQLFVNIYDVTYSYSVFGNIRNIVCDST